MSGAALAQAARELVGTRFRLHGRDVATGIDCIGVLGATLSAIGRKPVLPLSYGLRNLDVAQFAAFAQRNHLMDVQDEETGDVILFRVGPVQFHLAVDVGGGRLVHAHAGLRRVVMGTAGDEWTVEYRWRLSNQLGS
jgi:cell wall-associated NlpC family hydrolase